MILPLAALSLLDCVLEPAKEATLAEKEIHAKARLSPEAFLLKRSDQVFYNASLLDLKEIVGDQGTFEENLRSYTQAFSFHPNDQTCF